MPAHPLFRLARATVFSAVCVGLAAAGHLAAGGTVSSRTGVAGFAAVLALASLLAGRERTFVVIFPMLAGTQAGLHALFGLSGHDASHLHAVLPPSALALHHVHSGSPALGMILAHLCASLLSAWWLARGESALWSLLRRLGAAIVRLLPRPVVPVVAAPPREHAGPPAPRAPFLLRHAIVLRAPPADRALPDFALSRP